MPAYAQLQKLFLIREHFEAYGELYPDIGTRDAIRLFNTLVDGGFCEHDKLPQDPRPHPLPGIRIINREVIGLEPHPSSVRPDYLPPTTVVDVASYAIRTASIIETAHVIGRNHLAQTKPFKYLIQLATRLEQDVH